AVSILSATYTGAVHERVAQIEAIIQVSAARAGQTIPLFGDDVAVERFSATPAGVTLLRQGSSVNVHLPRTGAATLKVKFLVKLAAEIAATVFCRNSTLLTFSGGVMGVRSLLDYQVTQGELREARVRLAAGHRLLRVQGESIRTWQVRTGSASSKATPNPSK